MNTDCFATHSWEFCLFHSSLLHGKTCGIRGFADTLGSIGFAVYDVCMLAQQRSLKCVSQSPYKRLKIVYICLSKGVTSSAHEHEVEIDISL